MRFLTALLRTLFRWRDIAPEADPQTDRADNANLLTEAEREACRAAGRRGMRRRFLKRISESD